MSSSTFSMRGLRMFKRKPKVASPVREYKNRTVITIDWEVVRGGWSMKSEQVGHLDDDIKAALVEQLLRELDGKVSLSVRL